MTNGNNKKEWIKSFVTYLPQAIVLIICLIAGWVLKIDYNQRDLTKRVITLEEVTRKQWTNNGILKEEIKIQELNSSNHEQKANEAIKNIKENKRDLQTRIMRLERIHLK